MARREREVKQAGSLGSSLARSIGRVRHWSRLKSPWLLYYNSGSCNGCDIELLATITPRYDLERFGVRLKSSPRHADILVVTGPVTRQSRERLLRIYQQIPEPKFVVAVGTCALSGGVFRGSYASHDGVDSILPVDAYIPGCPPRPEAIIDGVVKLLGKLKESATSDKVEESVVTP